MPRGLWRRVEERFKPARVVEFYASTEAGAILVNLRGSKPGAMGRPLPGSAEVRIAEYDLDAQGLVLDRDGFAKQCGTDEVGMLLARVSPTEPLSITPLRSLFARDDAWVATGDLFRRDADADYWRVDGVGDVIHTDHGHVFTTAIRDALGEIPAVDLAAAYGVRPQVAEHELAVAAVTLRGGRSLTGRDVSQALSTLPREGRPAVVHVVDHIPVTTWFRPLTEKLREAGIPEPKEGVKAWCLDASGEHYRPLSAAARRRLSRPAGGRAGSNSGASARPDGTVQPKRAASRRSTA
jgi:putative long chain acyl-CoA synthase